MTSVASLFTQLDSTVRTGTDASTSIASDFSNFLNLLTIQLQNQDPLEPLDTNQFTEQIVQMTQVEQTVSMNQRLGSLIDAQETQQIQGAVQFVGKDADALGDVVPLTEERAEMFYVLPATASDIQVDIVDASNLNVVRSLQAPPMSAGMNRVSWDGLDNDGDAADPTKTYRLLVRPVNAENEEISSTVGFSGRVEELRHDDGALVLSIAGRPVALSNIVAARAPKPEPTPDA